MRAQIDVAVTRDQRRADRQQRASRVTPRADRRRSAVTSARANPTWRTTHSNSHSPVICHPAGQRRAA